MAIKCNSMVYKEVQVKTALNKLKRKIPYNWDLNIYRGCEHGCQYCYAIYSHKYLKSTDFFNDIFVKTNIVEKLDKQLSSPDWNREIINIGGVCDSYQPAEAEFKLMRGVLKVLIKHKNPIIISTKSNLILRDLDLISKLAESTYVNIASTITTMDEGIRRIIEPFSSPSLDRFNVLNEFGKTKASTGVHVMPILPFITDEKDNFNQIFKLAKECDVNYVLTGTLYLLGNTRVNFMKFLEKHFPELQQKYKELYQKGSANKNYKTDLYAMVKKIREKHQVSSNYMEPIKKRLKDTSRVR